MCWCFNDVLSLSLSLSTYTDAKADVLQDLSCNFPYVETLSQSDVPKTFLEVPSWMQSHDSSRKYLDETYNPETFLPCNVVEVVSCFAYDSMHTKADVPQFSFPLPRSRLSFE